MTPEALSGHPTFERTYSPRQVEQVSPPRMITRMHMTPGEAFSSFYRELRSYPVRGSKLHSHPVFRSGEGTHQGVGRTAILGGGLAAPDFSLSSMSYWLNMRDYRVVVLPSPNVESPEERAEMISKTVEKERRESDEIIYIGDSKAGFEIYLATEGIDTIITLGSPTNFPIELHPFVYEFYSFVRAGKSDESVVRKVLTNGYSRALSEVRIVSIIGEKDEIVRACGNWSGLATVKYIVPAKHMNITEIPQTYQVIDQELALNDGAKAA